jgi:ATP-binding cassette subfamily B protein
MILLITLINALRMPLFTLSFILDGFQRAAPGSKDFVQAMQVEPAVADKPNPPKLRIDTARIEFSDVDFAYTDGEPVLTGLSFALEPGQKLALVGESGVGKSTISNLLMRLYDVSSGQILIDGQNIAAVSQKSLRENIATVFQDSALFSGTIRENIAYGQPEATEAAVLTAAKAANAHEFIDKFENKYDTEIGERGIKLSGGQKQRLSIARALLKDAPILILDEATSSLDSRSEKRVQEALDRLTEGRTTLIIAHRLSTIANVDKIVTLKNGRIDEIGSPAELSKTGGIYAKLLDLQAGPSESAKRELQSYDIAS